jgi:hypothetical protein
LVRRRRKPNSNEEIQEIHDIILNVYESMDDQAHATLMSLLTIVQDENDIITIDDQIQAIIDIGHTLCCGKVALVLTCDAEFVFATSINIYMVLLSQLLFKSRMQHSSIRNYSLKNYLMTTYA